MKEKSYWIAFSAAGLDSRDLFKLLAHFKNLDTAWRMAAGNISRLRRTGLTDLKISFVSAGLKKITPEKELARIKADGTQVITWPEKEFPYLLKQIADPPAILYVRGNAQVLSSKALAVVGTRKSSFYGEKAAKKLVKDLSLAGLTIISGLANGIDYLAHQTTLDNEGITVGVTGYGFDHIPYSRKKLIDKMMAKGAIVSEYHPSFNAEKWTFVQRNRLISGLALGTLVIEAPLGSGALITADFANEQNRDLFMVPGPIDQDGSQGTNAMIKEGATPVTEANDVLGVLGLPLIRPGVTNETNLNPGEKAIIKSLMKSPMSLDQLVVQTGQTTAEILNTMTSLEIRGLITKTADGLCRIN